MTYSCISAQDVEQNLLFIHASSPDWRSTFDVLSSSFLPRITASASPLYRVHRGMYPIYVYWNSGKQCAPGP